MSHPCILQLCSYLYISPCLQFLPHFLIKRERLHAGADACSEVKLSRMGQVVQTATRVERGPHA